MELPRGRYCPISGAVLPRQQLRSACVHRNLLFLFLKACLYRESQRLNRHLTLEKQGTGHPLAVHCHLEACLLAPHKDS